MRDFPVVDISSFATGLTSERRALAREVDQVCRETGFLAIVGHGVSNEIIAEVWETARCFFDLPLNKKLEVAMPYVGYPYGYAPLQAEVLARSLRSEAPPDLKESFSIGPLDRPYLAEVEERSHTEAAFRFARNLWPNEPVKI